MGQNLTDLNHLSKGIYNSKHYTFTVDEKTGQLNLQLIDANENHKLARFRKKMIEPFYLKTKNDNLLACVHLRLSDNPKFTLLCNHGGTVDLGEVINYYFTLGRLLNCNIVGYDYSGFGISTGTHTEDNLYDDCESVFNYMIEKLNCKKFKIVLQGQSLGTIAAIHLASKYKVAGCILVSPFLKLANHFKSNFFSKHSIEKVEKINCPLLVIHGNQDTVTPLNQAREIYESASNPVKPLFIDGIGHWGIELDPKLLNRIKDFVIKEL